MNTNVTERKKNPLMRLAALLLVIGVLCITHDANANEVRRVVVDPGFEFGELNDAIENDIAPGGGRYPNTVYVLKRNAIYPLNGTIQNTDFHLHLVAEEGEGHPPIIIPGVQLDGSSQRPFVARGDITMEGIYLSNIDEIGAKKDQFFRIPAADVRIALDNCWFEWTEAGVIRIGNVGSRIYVTNSVFRNVGHRTRAGLGRWFDARGNNVDTLFVENNTFYNNSHYFFRPDGAFVTYLHVNHNTIFNNGKNFWIGRALEAHVTNNLFINPSFRGDNGTLNPFTVADPVIGERYFEAGVFEADSLAIPQFPDADRIIVFRNNNHWDDQRITDLIAAQPDTLIQPKKRFGPVWQSFINAEIPNLVVENVISEGLDFTNAPPPPLEWMAAHFANPSQETVLFQAAVEHMEARSINHWHDFSYNTGSASYTAGDNGFPLGDLNWFPEKKAEWLSSVTSVSDAVEMPAEFKLVGNYPNPFNPTTNIVFTMAQSDQVVLSVYNLLGQNVRTMPLGLKNAGQHEVVFDGSSLSSGVYLVRIQAGDMASRAMRIMLVK